MTLRFLTTLATLSFCALAGALGAKPHPPLKVELLPELAVPPEKEPVPCLKLTTTGDPADSVAAPMLLIPASFEGFAPMGDPAKQIYYVTNSQGTACAYTIKNSTKNFSCNCACLRNGQITVFDNLNAKAQKLLESDARALKLRKTGLTLGDLSWCIIDSVDGDRVVMDARVWIDANRTRHVMITVKLLDSGKIEIADLNPEPS